VARRVGFDLQGELGAADGPGQTGQGYQAEHFDRPQLVRLTPMQLYHYSRGLCLAKILADGHLIPSLAGLAPGERPGLWFTDSPRWSIDAGVQEKTDTGWRELSMREVHDWTGITRFITQATQQFKTWKYHKEYGGIPRWVAKRRYALSILQNDPLPSHWRVSYQPVLLDDCTIEAWNGSAWQPLNAELKAEIIEKNRGRQACCRWESLVPA
jgi:hypothetical protein